MVIKMSEGRIQNSVKNMVFGFMYQIMTLIMSFVSRTVFIRTLGTEYLGLNGIFTDVLSLLSMADLGFGTAMAYSFYKPLAEHDEEKIASLVQFYKKVYLQFLMSVFFHTPYLSRIHPIFYLIFQENFPYAA